MKPIILTGNRTYHVISETTEARYSLPSCSYDNGRKVSFIRANSPKAAVEIAKSRGCKVYGLRNPKTQEFYWPPELVSTLAELRKRSNEIPF